MDSKPIIIRVGQHKKNFFIHEKVLRASSAFFDNALKEVWKEGQEAAVDLPDTRPYDFEIWAKFLYTGRVYMGKDEAIINKREEMFEELWTWRNLYALGGFLQDNDFQYALIDTMVDWIAVSSMYPVDLAAYIYPHTKRDSSHRIFAIDVCLEVWPRADFREGDVQPAEFLTDVFKSLGPHLNNSLGKASMKDWALKIGDCNYHDHGDRPCYKTKSVFRFRMPPIMA